MREATCGPLTILWGMLAAAGFLVSARVLAGDENPVDGGGQQMLISFQERRPNAPEWGVLKDTCRGLAESKAIAATPDQSAHERWIEDATEAIKEARKLGAEKRWTEVLEVLWKATNSVPEPPLPKRIRDLQMKLFEIRVRALDEIDAQKARERNRERNKYRPTSGASGNQDEEGGGELVSYVRLNDKMQMVSSVQQRIHPCGAAWNKGPLKKGQKFLPLERAFEHRKGPVPAPWPTHHTKSVGGRLVWFYSQDTGEVLAMQSDILPGIFAAACGEPDQTDFKRWRGWGVRNPAFICELETQTRELTKEGERRAILNVQLVLDKNMAILGAMDSTNAEALSPESNKRCKLPQGK